MGLSEDIQQKNFTSIHQKAAINIIYTNNWLSEKFRSFLAEENLTNQQYNVLRILRGSQPEPLSTLKIRERMLDKMSDTSRIVDRLVIKKLVRKNTCETDKRLVDINITEEGLNILSKMDKKDSIDVHLKNLNPKEAETLSNLLDKVREI
tara:strand:+ start:227 stop:676 length:450 start_codon:yes stop_codon:yes gene_type:complete